MRFSARGSEDAERVRDGAADRSPVAVSDCLTIQGPHLSGVGGAGPVRVTVKPKD